ncbi:pyridoxamine 5'-phosphate oxidase family protein [Bacillus massilinigeriensis]|uniref:pyridoxamine 5'-phosphate oxidase family protein n=1 Tax=Bacillus mediterraneensis TaxID=1805474 RepID=UPI0008F7F0FA|nr:pyridoxamine 5'-phosphate oxidase family protein [Bacillus mediterraneensis]
MERTIIKNPAVLEELLGKPSEVVSNKAIPFIDRHCREFISHSPFLVIATADSSGRTDASPRGDKPGFVKVLDDHTIIIPERKGNKRMDTLRNILQNPRVGLIFFIPNLGETLRVNGTAIIFQDEGLSEDLAVNGKRPEVLIEIRVEEAFIHCAKAIIRSSLWISDSWPSPEELPSAANILADHVGMKGVSQESIEKNLKTSYVERLY